MMIHPSKLSECMVSGHEPLLVLEGAKLFQGKLRAAHEQSGIHFANIKFCKRCGLMYWEPPVEE